jgi:hypothetical protein
MVSKVQYQYVNLRMYPLMEAGGRGKAGGLVKFCSCVTAEIVSFHILIILLIAEQAYRKPPMSMKAI